MFDIFPESGWGGGRRRRSRDLSALGKGELKEGRSGSGTLHSGPLRDHEYISAKRNDSVR